MIKLRVKESDLLELFTEGNTLEGIFVKKGLPTNASFLEARRYWIDDGYYIIEFSFSHVDYNNQVFTLTLDGVS